MHAQGGHAPQANHMVAAANKLGHHQEGPRHAYWRPRPSLPLPPLWRLRGGGAPALLRAAASFFSAIAASNLVHALADRLQLPSQHRHLWLKTHPPGLPSNLHSPIGRTREPQGTLLVSYENLGLPSVLPLLAPI